MKTKRLKNLEHGWSLPGSTKLPRKYGICNDGSRRLWQKRPGEIWTVLLSRLVSTHVSSKRDTNVLLTLIARANIHPAYYTPKGKEIKDVASFSKFKRYDDMSIFGHQLVPMWTNHFDNSLLFNNTYCQLNIFLIMNPILNIIKIDN